MIIFDQMGSCLHHRAAVVPVLGISDCNRSENYNAFASVVEMCDEQNRRRGGAEITKLFVESICNDDDDDCHYHKLIASIEASTHVRVLEIMIQEALTCARGQRHIGQQESWVFISSSTLITSFDCVCMSTRSFVPIVISKSVVYWERIMWVIHRSCSVISTDLSHDTFACIHVI